MTGAEREPTEWVIEGLTEDGEVFRPSDWVERLLETVLSYGLDRRVNHRPYHGPERRSRQIELLQPRICDGRKCLVVDLQLREVNPQAFNVLMDFVRSNRLRCRENT